VFDAKSKSKVRVEARLVPLRFKVGEKPPFILGRMRRIYGDKCVVDSGICRVELIDDVKKIANSLIL
jgi:hypothetical protein